MSDSQAGEASSPQVSVQDNLGTIPCNICRRQFSRYTCPRCNIPYCSLTCFRSESHSECSETFYKKELESQIKSEPSKSSDERRKMMELLQRFEEESAEDAAALEADEEDDDLANRLEVLDLEHASYDEIWSALSPAERDKFTKALGDPSGDLAQQLLSSEELEEDLIEPWWERHADDVAQERTAFPRTKQYGEPPPPLSVPPTMMNASAASSASSPSLLYNIAAILIAYAYTTRHFSTSPLSLLQDPDRQAARQTISQLVPFLIDKRFTPGTIAAESFTVLLRDASTLFRPHLVAQLPSETEDSTSNAAAAPNHVSRALNDISMLFQPPPQDASHTPGPKDTHVSHKLTFYAARILTTSTSVLRMLADEIAARASQVEREGLDAGKKAQDTKRSQLVIDDEVPRRDVRTQTGGSSDPVRRAFIEELS
ncbi:hypothetical protein EIP91_007594 [Steccherinum ochraceum]|uniref:HIT-type domain-containing protein n=1 Tax=Steccherinum ochraceum TaxID=92696 RepID=A0A4R0RYQ9_9APHY|nr:hypothetical protein EIP91_007594 [Steccherinum ochraceum]